VFVAFVIKPRKAHAPYHIVICGMSSCTIFFHITSQTARLSGEKKVTEHKMRVFSSAHFVWNIYDSRNKWTRHQNIHLSLHVKYSLFLSDFNVTWILYDRFFEKYLNTKFHKNPSSGSRVVPCGRTNGLPDMKLWIAFRSYAEAPHKMNEVLTEKLQKTRFEPPELTHVLCGRLHNTKRLGLPVPNNTP
jgi:hypothetical protein